MLIYDIDSLSSQIETKILMVNNQLDFHNSKRKCLLEYTLKITDCINSITTVDDTSFLFKFIDKLKESLNSINSNIDFLKTLLNTLKELNTSLEKNSLIKNDIDNYNKTYANFDAKIINNLIKIENTFQDFCSYIYFNFDSNIFKEESTNVEELTNCNVEIPKISDNKTLLISEKKGKIFLPYSVKDLEYKLNNSHGEYSSLEDVINRDYIIPLARYANPAFARFREAFNLMRYKENASIIKSLDLASELCFKQTLNPAVISACKNIDELDIYLNLLDENDLENFKIFNIQFEFAPSVK